MTLMKIASRIMFVVACVITAASVLLAAYVAHMRELTPNTPFNFALVLASPYPHKRAKTHHPLKIPAH